MMMARLGFISSATVVTSGKLPPCGRNLVDQGIIPIARQGMSLGARSVAMSRNRIRHYSILTKRNSKENADSV